MLIFLLLVVLISLGLFGDCTVFFGLFWMDLLGALLLESFILSFWDIPLGVWLNCTFVALFLVKIPEKGNNSIVTELLGCMCTYDENNLVMTELFSYYKETHN